MKIPPRPGAEWTFNPPPGWPPTPDGWEPAEGWGGPDPSWPKPPPYWDWWTRPETLAMRDPDDRRAADPMSSTKTRGRGVRTAIGAAVAGALCLIAVLLATASGGSGDAPADTTIGAEQQIGGEQGPNAAAMAGEPATPEETRQPTSTFVRQADGGTFQTPQDFIETMTSLGIECIDAQYGESARFGNPLGQCWTGTGMVTVILTASEGNMRLILLNTRNIHPRVFGENWILDAHEDASVAQQVKTLIGGTYLP